MNLLKKYGFAWVTAGFLVVTLVGHWFFGWLAYVDEQQTHGAAIEVGANVQQARALRGNR